MKLTLQLNYIFHNEHVDESDKFQQILIKRYPVQQLARRRVRMWTFTVTSEETPSPWLVE